MPKAKSTPTTVQVQPNIYKEGSMMVVKLATNKPPVFVEKKDKDWVYFGTKNEYPNYLLDLFNQSAKHGAIIQQKAYYIAGGGYVGEVGETIINEEDETLNDITKKSTLDYEIFGGFALEVIWKRGGKGFILHHVDFSNIRSNKDNTEFYYTKNWIKTGEYSGQPILNTRPEEEEDWQVYSAFDGVNKKGKQIYYFKSYRPGLDVYPLPVYIGAISYVNIDIDIANYWYNAVKRGFAPSHIINFYNGSPTPEEQKKIEKQIIEKFTGTDNAGKFILNFSDSKETGGSEIQNITPIDLDKQFNILNATVQEEIFSAHRVTSPALFGIRSQTGNMSPNKDELRNADELFKNVYVKPTQELIEDAYEYLMAFGGITDELELNNIEPIALDLIGNKEAWNVLTDDEQREAIGKEPLPVENEGTQSLLSLINGVNGNVGDAILASLTVNERRSLAGLLPIPNGDILPDAQPNAPQVNNTPPAVLPKPVLPTPMASMPQGFPIPKEMGACVKKLMDEGKPQDQAVAICIKETQKMSELKAISMFKEMGKVGGKRVASRQMNEIDFAGLADNENEFKQSFIDPNLKATELSVLDLLSKNPLMEATEMARVLKTDVKTINKAVESLKNKDLIKSENVKSGDSTIVSLNPVKDAGKILSQNPAPTEQIYVKYSYEWLPGFSDSDLKSSRDFCVELRGMSKAGKLWTRDEIETISAQSGMNVWEMRGGWYTKPDTNIHIPHCRHRWSQNIILE